VRIRRRSRRLRQAGKQLAGHIRVNMRLALGRAFNGGYQLLARRILEQVAGRPAANGVEDPLVGVVGGKRQHPHAGMALTDQAGSLDAVHARHLQIHQHHIRPGVRDQLQCLGAILRYAHHLDPRRRAQDGLQSLAHQVLVVTNQYPNAHTRT